DVTHFAFADQFVGLGQRAANRLFKKDVRAGLGTGDDHVMMGVEPAVRDADELRPLLLEHLAIVRVSVLRAKPFRRLGTSFFVFVGNSYNLDVVLSFPDNVEAMAVIAFTGPADDSDTIVFCHEDASRRAVSYRLHGS